MSTTQLTAIEKYELAAAAEVWDRLSKDNQAILLNLRNSPQAKRTESVYEEKADGFRHFVRTDISEDSKMEPMMALQLVCSGYGTGGWVDQNNRPIDGPAWPAYKLTDFGMIVARYGQAKTIVELAGNA